MAEEEQSAGATRRDVGIWGAAFLALNGMIGAAIFGLPGKLDAAVGSFAPWLLLIGGLGVMLIALCYADLASRFDASGGPQLYAGAAFGRFAGFQAGWMIYASRAAALAANATVLTAYAGAVWKPLDSAWTIIVTVAAITLINVVGIRRAVSMLGGLTMLKLAPLVVIAATGTGPGADRGAGLAAYVGGGGGRPGRSLCLCRIRGGDRAGRRNPQPEGSHPQGPDRHRGRRHDLLCPDPALPIPRRASATATRPSPISRGMRSARSALCCLG